MADENMSISVPQDVSAGEFADMAAVWHGPYGFTIDFLSQVNPQPIPGQPSHQVVARVRIPPAVIFPLMQALSDQLEKYEQRFGAIKPPSDTSDEEQ